MVRSQKPAVLQEAPKVESETGPVEDRTAGIPLPTGPQTGGPDAEAGHPHETCGL